MSDNASQLSVNRSPARPAGTGSVDPVLDRSFANPLANGSSRRGAERTIAAPVAGEEFHDEGTLVIEEHFAIVPEWIIDADISDCAYRLYSILLRYGQSSGQRMPGRALLAKRLRKRSKDSVGH